MEKKRIIKPDQYSLNGSAIFEGDALHTLYKLPSDSIQCAITSPPYWGVRDYGVDGQIGLEKTLPQYINKLVSIFAEVKRVLKPKGVLWVNIGDGYTSGNRGYRAPDKKNRARAMSSRPDTPDGLKPKDLIGIPWRLAFALQENGWYLRTDIVWHKPNAMPESVKDRPSRSHEYIFMFSKSERYDYDGNAIKEDTVNGPKRNKRTIWNVNKQNYQGSHFATFPTELIEPCVLSTSIENDYILDPFSGTGTVGIVSHLYGRHFIGVELNPNYVSMSLDRLSDIDDAYIKLVV